MSYTFTQLNETANRLIGIAAATWSYFLNSLLTVCMACNRFYVLFFPFGIPLLRGTSVANWAIGVSMLVVTIFGLCSLPEGCACVYDPNMFSWRLEYSECSDMTSPYIPFFVFGTTFISNFLNVTTIIRLLMEKMTGMNVDESTRRRKRFKIMFMQNVTQDCLQLIDTINSYYIYAINFVPWFVFLFTTFSFIVVTAIDGFVMFIFQSDIHPEWLKSMTQKKNSKVSVVKPSTSAF